MSWRLVSSCREAEVHVHRVCASVQPQSRHSPTHQTFAPTNKFIQGKGDCSDETLTFMQKRDTNITYGNVARANLSLPHSLLQEIDNLMSLSGPESSLTNLLVILPLSLAEMEESSGGASGECESACARLCCSKLYSLSSASNVPEREREKKCSKMCMKRKLYLLKQEH